LLQGLAVYQWKASEKTSVSAGAQYVNKKIESNDRGNHQLDQAGTFIVLNQRLGDNLNISPALRLDWMERTGWEVVPQLNASYKINQLNLRASAGRTTRDADFTERFNNYNKTIVTGGSIGNPDLELEQSFSYEAGADFFGIKDLKIAATYFRRNHSDLIDYVPTPYTEMPRKTNLVPIGRYALAKNIGEVKTSGVEVDAQIIKAIQTDQQIWATVGLTLLNTKSNSGTPSFYLSSHAKLLLNTSFNYTIKWLTISASGVYKERSPQTALPINAMISKDYFVMNLKLQAMLLNNTIGAFVQLDNVTDKRYSDLLGSQMPGRWLMGGLKFSL
jgi:iron complex outermembrane receptor protein